ncbi:hypothetical protein ACCO45_006827 [Purpureocillium lilacinum]|uniref:Uncharacterized protein n=1 Tax=Purpureocillium lilacinum TaxID=33203 RepID=A0ACC4DQK8_PURLI
MPSTCVRDASPFAHDIHLARGLAGPSVGAHVGAVRAASAGHGGRDTAEEYERIEPRLATVLGTEELDAQWQMQTAQGSISTPTVPARSRRRAPRSVPSTSPQVPVSQSRRAGTLRPPITTTPPTYVCCPGADLAVHRSACSAPQRIALNGSPSPTPYLGLPGLPLLHHLTTTSPQLWWSLAGGLR